MNDAPVLLDGGCRCGRVRFRVTAPPLLTFACHCTGCQRMTASAFSLSAAIPANGFALTQGETVIGGLHGEHRHQFCGYCMSWLFTHVHGFDTFVNVRATMLDDPSWFVPFVETMTSEKLPWVTTPAVHRCERWPAIEDFAWLTQDYAARGSRPRAASQRA